jgi:cupin 2 domain-containing protein
MTLTKGNIFIGRNTLGKDAEYFEEILQTKNARIQRIVSCGQISDWYGQEEDEWVLLLSGEAELEFENNLQVKMGEGDFIFISAHQRHKVTRTSTDPPCVWLAVFGQFQLNSAHE